MSHDQRHLVRQPSKIAGRETPRLQLHESRLGVVWRPLGNLRRIASMEILSNHRIQTFADIRGNEVHLLVKRLMRGRSEDGHNIVDMKLAFFETMLNVMMRMISGKRWIGVDKLEKKPKVLTEKRDSFMQDLIDEHRKMIRGCEGQRIQTLIDVLLSLQETDPECYTHEVIRGLMQVMLLAGTETSIATMEWAILLLLNNPDALIQAQNEIDDRIGNSRLVDDSDLPHLPYLHAIVNETLRMYPPAPMLAPHESSIECMVGGYCVPAGTMLLLNLWAIQHDPELWDEPKTFKSERFINFERKKRRICLDAIWLRKEAMPGRKFGNACCWLGLGVAHSML
ncbi:UNVERIFIED_CONTAM: Isoflavone 2'-hydroxylase [Sesamum angustifolium]|uniref:Isoflavone 2'-hydroxylase n=1 Tax=Sesamum angustifolium TaxID=2727405 RepID=A0AAW2L9G3_9LAMI